MTKYLEKDQEEEEEEGRKNKKEKKRKEEKKQRERAIGEVQRGSHEHFRKHSAERYFCSKDFL